MKKCMFIFLCVVTSGFQEMYADNASNYAGSLNREIPIVSSVGPLAVANLKLNYQGNVIVARSGEKIFSTLNFSCETPFVTPNSLYQIVVGYDEIGPQKCILNELGYQIEGKEGILSFFCEAPSTPGIYEVQCHMSSASSSVEALQKWWDQPMGDHNEKVTIGRIIVK